MYTQEFSTALNRCCKHNGQSARRCRCLQKPNAAQSPHTVNRRSTSGQSLALVITLSSERGLRGGRGLICKWAVNHEMKPCDWLVSPYHYLTTTSFSLLIKWSGYIGQDHLCDNNTGSCNVCGLDLGKFCRLKVVVVIQHEKSHKRQAMHIDRLAPCLTPDSHTATTSNTTACPTNDDTVWNDQPKWPTAKTVTTSD